ncbi:MAG: hypothetical protein VKJ02_00190 [Snowella sp.]|nr:hypothetical protein [Snowella sp.]
MHLFSKLSRLKRIFLAPDILVSLLIALIVWYISPDKILNEFSRDIYSVGITVLSIVFSVYFAALAIMISSSDDEFVEFLEQDGGYTTLISNFRFALGVLLFALVYSIVLYTVTTVWFYSKKVEQSEYLFILFVFISIYGLLATFAASSDAINYALYRAKFLRLRKKHDNHSLQQKDNEP